MNGKPQPLLYSRVPRDELKRPDGPMPTLPRLKGMSVFWVHLVAPPPSHRATVATAVPVYERRALMLRKVRRHMQTTILLHLNSPPTCVLCCAVLAAAIV